MALFPCGSCGNEISDQALSCPKCGAPGPGHFAKKKAKESAASPYVVIGTVVAIGGTIGFCGFGNQLSGIAIFVGLGFFVVGRLITSASG